MEIKCAFQNINDHPVIMWKGIYITISSASPSTGRIKNTRKLRSGNARVYI
jgi:hypothetical protein